MQSRTLSALLTNDFKIMSATEEQEKFQRIDEKELTPQFQMSKILLETDTNHESRIFTGWSFEYCHYGRDVM